MHISQFGEIFIDFLLNLCNTLPNLNEGMSL